MVKMVLLIRIYLSNWAIKNGDSVKNIILLRLNRLSSGGCNGTRRCESYNVGKRTQYQYGQITGFYS